ncbi:hypothetical protein M8J77_012988 [Diaphorina citri]|nr:hypothetical protein M8J77_012988 [Diaphorina citri]
MSEVLEVYDDVFIQINVTVMSHQPKMKEPIRLQEILTLLQLRSVLHSCSLYSPRQLGSPMEAHGGEPQLLNYIANPQNEPEFQLAVSACGRDEQLLFYGAAAECLIQRSETRFM